VQQYTRVFHDFDNQQPLFLHAVSATGHSMCSLQGTNWFFLRNVHSFQSSMPYNGSLVGLSSRRLRFDRRSLHVRFVVGKVTLRQGFFFRVLRFTPLSIIPLVLHTHLHVVYMLLLTERLKERTWEPSKKLCYFVNRGALYRKVF